MTINIYWACLENEWMLAEEPEMVSKRFYNKKMYNDSAGACLNICPAFNEELKNLYAIKSVVNFSFEVKEDRVIPKNMPQDDFDRFFVLRDLNLRMFSFRNKYIFFTEEESLPVSFYQYPFLEDNDVTKKCMTIPGTFDIGKWFRNIEFSFYLKKEFNDLQINKEDVLFYSRFKTQEKIKFTEFYMTDKLMEYGRSGFALNGRNNFSSMQNFYNKFKLKKLILKEIKQNIV